MWARERERGKETRERALANKEEYKTGLVTWITNISMLRVLLGTLVAFAAAQAPSDGQAVKIVSCYDDAGGLPSSQAYQVPS